MDLPKYNALYAPLLRAVSDGKVYEMKEVCRRTALEAGVTAQQAAECYPDKPKSIFDHRVHWARMYLKKAGMLDSPRRAHIQITAAGEALLASGERITNELLARLSPSFAEFVGRKGRRR